MAIESDEAAAGTYRQNFGEHVVNDEIQKCKEFPTAQVVVGGPPCQGFSLLGNRDEDDDRNELWRHYWRVVRTVEPEIFVLENVPGFLKSPQYGSLFRSARRMQYEVEARVLNTADFGASQLRKRAIVIGRRNRRPLFPTVTHEDPLAKKPTLDRLPWNTVRGAFAGIPLKPDRGRDVTARPLTTRDLHFDRNFTATSLLRFQQVPEGGNRVDLQEKRPDITPPCWIRRKTVGGTDVFGRLYWDRPSVTIRTEFFKPEKGRYLHPSEHRAITAYEAARLQGFPDSYKWMGTKIEIARQIGNAVPVPFAQAIGHAILQMLDREAPPLSTYPAFDWGAECSSLMWSDNREPVPTR